MKTFINWLLVLAILHFANGTAYEYSNGYHVKELISVTNQRFILEAEPWNIVGALISNKTTACGNYLLLGGYGVVTKDSYLERVYTSLPAHNMVYFQIQFFMIDDWSQSDGFKILFDGLDIGAFRVIFNNSNFPSNICGSSYNDLPEFTLTAKVLHNSENLTVTVITKVHGNAPFPTFGIRNVSFIFTNVSLPLKEDNCYHIPNDNAILGGTQAMKCPCPASTYPDPLNRNSCLSCNESCSDCFGASAGECYDCKPGYSFVQNECVKCDSSCSTCTGPGPDQCVTCQSGLWLYWNNTCLTICDSPPQAQEEIDDFKVCHSPCLSPTPIMQWNQTCGDSCQPPMVEIILRNDKLCQKPCKGEDFLYPNGSCLGTCSLPFLRNTTDNISLCKYPCRFSANEYLFPDGSCSNSCPPPFIQRITNEFKFCDSSNNPKEEPVNQLNDILTASGSIVSVGIMATSIASPGSSSVSLACLAKMLHYIRYMNINYPQKLEDILRDQNSSSISLNFGPEMPQVIEDKFPKYPLLDKFGYYNLHSSFIVNFGEVISTLTIVFIFVILSSFLSHLSAKLRKEYIHLICLRIKNITKWDLCLIIFCTNLAEVAFSSSLEIKTIAYFDSWLAYLSLLVCIVIIFIAALIIISTLLLVVKLRRRKFKFISPSPTESSGEKKQIKGSSFQILIKSFKEDSFLQQSFMIFFLIRVIVFHLVIGYFPKYPLFQAIFITIMSIIMLAYLIMQRPFREKLDLFEFIINEGILLVVNINVLVMAALDHANSEAIDVRRSCGEIIIICNMAFNSLALAFLVIDIAFGLIKAYRILKTFKGQTTWMKIFSLLFEKDGMVLEDKHDQIPKNNLSISIKLQSDYQPVDDTNTNNNLLNSPKESSPKPSPLMMSRGISERSIITITSSSPEKASSRQEKTLRQLIRIGSWRQINIIKDEKSDILTLNVDDMKSKPNPPPSLFRSIDTEYSSGIESLKLSQINIYKTPITPRRNLLRKKLTSTTGLSPLNGNSVRCTEISSTSDKNFGNTNLTVSPLSFQSKANEINSEKLLTSTINEQGSEIRSIIVEDSSPKKISL